MGLAVPYGEWWFSPCISLYEEIPAMSTPISFFHINIIDE